jgi:multidrug resistance efflux pump
MIRKYVLPLVALGLLLFAVMYVVRGQSEAPPQPPAVQPPATPYAQTVAGAGIVEAQTENIAVGSPLPGIVTQVEGKVGQKVEVGTPLFRLDDRSLKAELRFREAALTAAEAQLARLRAQPRPEEVPPSAAKVQEAQANWEDQKDLLERARSLHSHRAVSEEELARRQQAFHMAAAQLARVKAEHAMLLKGAWDADLGVAEAAVQQARAQVEMTRTELDRLVVRALTAGEVLQVNVRPGEFVGAPPGQALVVLGSVYQLHVRVDIDEHDIPRFRVGVPARATFRGSPGQSFPLRFVRVEPYVVPKKSLTGDNTERVDTRVLQVIYALEETNGRPIYVGQQLDVFIDGSDVHR